MDHFTFAGYWERGDALSHAIAWLLLAMSLTSWFFIFAKGVMAWRVRNSARVVQRFWDAPTLQDGVAVVAAGDPERIYLALAEQGIAPAVQGGSQLSATSLGTSVSRSEQMTRLLRDAIHRSTIRLESGLTLLASIASTAPFVGLLGTVWGIYHALAAVSSSGTVEIDKVAGPVGEALIMTGVGLMVAIPAVLAYNGYNRVNRLTLSELDAFAHDLHAYLTRH
ncbi:outer membrane transport energization protein ExbB (TC 2.C.1.1.1) [Pseudoduganella flava]|uniref:Biopolymer transport protein ExbB n=1 Tax=Pseudoduganella flava TaxID=871742 RepID=A0A562PWX3_9BURK|nr:MotA/TolQ/ExbB proton channel family protein [Pseudoduganella flava]QGZ39976.1 MotA/TolQ/ExbB proton channel family protein [Pseudoduganella flava]TWI48917.1 outer membrane transport energization protein ExbB (TC 2.C.1.1.1) [Pseudoduganella flava]